MGLEMLTRELAELWNPGLDGHSKSHHVSIEYLLPIQFEQRLWFKPNS